MSPTSGTALSRLSRSSPTHRPRRSCAPLSLSFASSPRVRTRPSAGSSTRRRQRLSVPTPMRPSLFTASHRGGAGAPLVCLHGFTDTWRTWELVLPELERHHDVLAPTLPGQAGGPPLQEPVTDALIADAIERAMDEAGFETAHIAGNSLGGYVALQLAARGRAESVVAFAPAGGWGADDDSFKEALRFQATIHDQAKATAPHGPAVLASPAGRRRATPFITTHLQH